MTSDLAAVFQNAQSPSPESATWEPPPPVDRRSRESPGKTIGSHPGAGSGLSDQTTSRDCWAGETSPPGRTRVCMGRLPVNMLATAQFPGGRKSA